MRSVLIGISVAVMFSLAVGPAIAEKPKKPKKGDGVSVARVSDGSQHEQVRGTQWLIYDDNSREGWGTDYSPVYDAIGNKFTSTWGTFYCDMVSAFGRWTSAGSGFYYSAWTGLSGTTLQSNAYTSFTSLTPTTGTGWVVADGSVTPQGWIGDTAYVFNNTAWIGNDFWTGNEIGVDTNGPGSHGFLVTAYTGTGYTEQSFNAMIRARFNGDNVPVELLSFTVR